VDLPFLADYLIDEALYVGPQHFILLPVDPYLIVDFFLAEGLVVD
jgi:hypothetical protein